MKYVSQYIKVLMVLVFMLLITLALLYYLIVATPLLSAGTFLSSSEHEIVLATISCGGDLQRDMAANLFRSMLMFTDYDHEYTFMLFTDTISWRPMFQQILRNFTRKEPELRAKLLYLELPKKAEDDITDQFKRCAGYRVTQGFYQRLIMQGYPRAIYVDSDTLVFDNLAQLWSLWGLMEGKAFGLVPENVKSGGWYDKWKLRGRYESNDVYGPFGINSGVVLYDPKVALQQQVGAVFADIIATRRRKLLLFDQDLLSIACQDRKYSIQCQLLPCRWNYRHTEMSGICLSERQEGIGIIHGNAEQLGRAQPFAHRRHYEHMRNYPLTLWWNVFSLCDHRAHCLESMEAELKPMIDPYNKSTSCKPVDTLFGMEFNGSEFDFARTQPKVDFSTITDMYCRQLHKVHQVQTWLKSVSE